MNFEPKLSRRPELKKIGQNQLVKKNVNIQKQDGITEIKKVNNIPEIIKTATVSAFEETETKGTVLQEVKITKSNTPANEPKQASVDINYYNLIGETLEDAGFEVTEELKNQIFIVLMNAHIEGNLKLAVDISDVTRLIDINLSGKYTGVDLNVTTVTKLIDKILSDSSTDGEKATDAEVRQFILDKAKELISASEPNTPAVQVNVMPSLTKVTALSLLYFKSMITDIATLAEI